MAVSITLVLAFAGTGKAACFDVVDSYWDNYGNFWVCEWNWDEWCFRWYCIEEARELKLGEMSTPADVGSELIDGWDFGPLGATENPSMYELKDGRDLGRFISDEGITKNTGNSETAKVGGRNNTLTAAIDNWATVDLKGQMPLPYQYTVRLAAVD